MGGSGRLGKRATRAVFRPDSGDRADCQRRRSRNESRHVRGNGQLGADDGNGNDHCRRFANAWRKTRWYG